MMDLFTETHWELITGPDGTEGQVYYDILIAALQADDVTDNGGDNNYCNGTPNGIVIAQAFANHGITLVAATNLAHEPLAATPPNNPITISTTVTNIPGACGFSSAFVKYRTDDVSPWQLVPLTTNNTLIYEGVIPAQPAGTMAQTARRFRVQQRAAHPPETARDGRAHALDQPAQGRDQPAVRATTTRRAGDRD